MALPGWIRINTSTMKWAILVLIVVSSASIMFSLFNNSSLHYSVITAYTEDLDYLDHIVEKDPGYRKLLKRVKVLDPLQPYVDPRSSSYPAPNDQSNGYIYAKIYGGFENIRTSICDLVAVSRLLNATLIIPELQQSLRSKGISSKFKSFSYLYDEEKFIKALAKDVMIVKNPPESIKEGRKRKQYPIFRPQASSSADFYLQEVLPKLKTSKVIGIILKDGGCLQSILPLSFVEYQRLRCRVAFHALHFRAEIVEVARKMVARLRGYGEPYIAYHPGLKRDTLAYHGCAELFQDLHLELIQHRRAEMIKEGIVKEELSVESHSRKASCPLMPLEVAVVLRAIGYPRRARIFVAGSETFGGQRILIPLHTEFYSPVDRSSLCRKQELADLIGPETPLPDLFKFPPKKSSKQLKEEWDKAGPRPRPLPPPPHRPIYRHEKEGWYGWLGDTDSEPELTQNDLRDQAHRLLWDALDYVVSVEADAFFPGFENDGSGWPDFSGLVMGHRLYKMASSRTYRPDRNILTKIFNGTTKDKYYNYTDNNWAILAREHLNRSLAEDGILRGLNQSKPNSFLSHPLPECLCTTESGASLDKDSSLRTLYEGLDKCPLEIEQGLREFELLRANTNTVEQEEEIEVEENISHEMLKSDVNIPVDSVVSSEIDEEMDPFD